MVWDRYIGQSKGVGACYCCGEEIDSKNFEAGHIIPEAKVDTLMKKIQDQYVAVVINLWELKI